MLEASFRTKPNGSQTALTMLLKAPRVQGFPEAMPTQLRHYADEYRRGAFANRAPLIIEIVKFGGGPVPRPS